MSRQHFQLLVVCYQLGAISLYIVTPLTDHLLPPELKAYLGVEEGVLADGPDFSLVFQDRIWFFTVCNSVLLFIASLGLFLFKEWGRQLFVLSTVFLLLLTPVGGPFVTTGWTALVATLVGISEGMILALIYFTPLSQEFERADQAHEQAK